MSISTHLIAAVLSGGLVGSWIMHMAPDVGVKLTDEFKEKIATEQLSQDDQCKLINDFGRQLDLTAQRAGNAAFVWTPPEPCG